MSDDARELLRRFLDLWNGRKTIRDGLWTDLEGIADAYRAYLAAPPPVEPRSPTLEGAAARVVAHCRDVLDNPHGPYEDALERRLRLRVSIDALDFLLRGDRGPG